MKPLSVLLLTAVIGQSSSASAAAAAGFEVPPGFEVSLYADDSLAHDIFSMTIDAHGRVVVAGKGYVKILHDTDGDGRADKATQFADMPKSGAHGMCFDGNDLICDGDNGIRRLSDTDGDGRCDIISPPWFPTTKDGEHAANGIVRGPDGWFYIACGNDAGINREHARTPGSPVKDPNSGVMARFSPDGKQVELIADGFRNPYDLDFNHLGNLFTVDADGERVYHAPFYTPNRLFDVAQGMHHGWILPGWMRCWSRPQCWPDNVERAVEIGRGSPTGVVAYRHHAFPARYRNGIFSMCWTFGRIYFFPLEPRGSTYQCKMEVFMKTTGEVGFAPTDMAVGPEGDLFISIGGRGTQGSVFRIHYNDAGKRQAPVDPVRAVLTAPQPLSSWSRVRWIPAAQKVGKDPFVAAVLDSKLPIDERIRAVEILTELFGGVPVDVAKTLCESTVEDTLLARALWSLSRANSSADARRLLIHATMIDEPRVLRTAWEGLIALPTPLTADESPDWRRGLNHQDRRVRSAALLAARGSGRRAYDAGRANWDMATARELLADCWLDGSKDPNRTFAICERISRTESDPSVRLEAVRLMQIALGDVITDEGPKSLFIGYAAPGVDRIERKLRVGAAQHLAESFPTPDNDLNLETARLLGMLAEETTTLLERIAQRWTEQSSTEEDLHYLLVAARLPGKRSSTVTARTAYALNAIYPKLARLNARPVDQLPSILEGLFDELRRHDPELGRALVADSGFGAPGHELYANRLPPLERQAAARKLLKALSALDEDAAQAAWNGELVRLTAALPDAEALLILRERFQDPRLADSIALVLAQKGSDEDRGRLVRALNSSQGPVVAAAAKKLFSLPGKPSAADLAAGVRALRRFNTKNDAVARTAVSELMTRWSDGVAVNVSKSDDPALLGEAWSTWFLKHYAKEGPTLLGMSGADSGAWKKRLERVDFTSGDVARGKVVFDRRSCFRCHGDARRLGPDLTGAAQRFSRDDLFLAIIEPSKDISPAFQPTTIVTTSGKIHNGMKIYDSQELTLLQTTADITVRIPGNEVQLVQPSQISFMPRGLLDDANDAELADLYAYLRTLRKD